MPLYWGIIFLIFLFIEIVTINLVTIWFALAALVCLIISLFNSSIIFQLIIFLISSVVFLFLTKPIVKKLKISEFVPTNYDRVIGKVGVVTKEIGIKSAGEVKVLGSLWTAMSNEEIKIGENVIVEKIEGVKLIVKKEDK